MAWDLAKTPNMGHTVVIDGDAHLNNFGFYGTPQRDLVMDLNADSMSLVALVFAMEEEFGVGATELSGLVTDSRTIGDLVAAVEKLQKA